MISPSPLAVCFFNTLNHAHTLIITSDTILRTASAFLENSRLRIALHSDPIDAVMAAATGIAALDDNDRVSHFMTWAKHFTGSKPLVKDTGSQKILQETSHENLETKEPLRDSTCQKLARRIQEQDNLDHDADANTTKTEPLPLRVVNEPKVAVKTIEHNDNTPQNPVISVAHDAARQIAVAGSAPIAVNKLYIEPEEDIEARPSSMTSAQRRLMQKIDPQAFKEHQNQQRTTSPAQVEGLEESVAVKEESPSPLKHESGEVNAQSMQHGGDQKPQGLLLSIHARSTPKHFRPRVRNEGPSRVHAPSKTLPSWMTVGEKHSSMEYFDEKQREYYSAKQGPAKGAGTVVQNEDKESLSSPPNKISAGLNPEAAEYKWTHSERPPVEVLINDAQYQEEHDKPGVVLGTREATKTPTQPIYDRFQECAIESTSSSMTVDMADELTLIENAERKPVKQDSHRNSNRSQDGGRCDKGFDLTPMLNVLTARTGKKPATVKLEEIERTTNGDRVQENQHPAIQYPEKNCTADANNSRTLVLKNLPRNSDYTLIQSLIHDAMILKMGMDEEEQRAYVKLASHHVCRQLVESCGGSKDIRHKGKAYTIQLEVSSKSDEQDDVLDAYLRCGATRSVKVEDIDMDVSMQELLRLGQGADRSRVTETIKDSLRGGVRDVVFRFISIHDAVNFRSSLERIDGWKCNEAKFVKDS